MFSIFSSTHGMTGLDNQICIFRNPYLHLECRAPLLNPVQLLMFVYRCIANLFAVHMQIC